MKKHVVIIGAGLAGCFLAIGLARRGYTVTVYERSTKEELLHLASKKSFALTFYAYAVSVLKKEKLWDAIRPIALSLDGAVTHIHAQTKPLFHPIDKTTPYYAVERSRILNVLIDQATQYPTVSFHFSTKLISVDRQNKKILVQDTVSKEYKDITCMALFGADGVHSRVRNFLQEGQATTHAQRVLPWIYKQFRIPKEDAEQMRLQKNVMHSWTSKDAVLVAFPEVEGSCAGMIIVSEEPGFSPFIKTNSLGSFIATNFPDFLLGVPLLQEAIEKNPEGSFVTIQTTPWYYKDFMVLIGDAAHGLLPFNGQGMSAAFGDCVTLFDLLDTHGDDWGKIFLQYQNIRKPNMDALAHLSEIGFARYRRQKRADYFAVYEKVEALLHRFLPSVVQPPLFTLVARDPTNTAHFIARHKRQRKYTQLLGLPVLVALLTGILAIQERVMKGKRSI